MFEELIEHQQLPKLLVLPLEYSELADAGLGRELNNWASKVAANNKRFLLVQPKNVGLLSEHIQRKRLPGCQGWRCFLGLAGRGGIKWILYGFLKRHQYSEYAVCYQLIDVENELVYDMEIAPSYDKPHHLYDGIAQVLKNLLARPDNSTADRSRLELEIAGAGEVYLNGVAYGELRAFDSTMPCGSYELKVIRSGYADYSAQLLLWPEQELHQLIDYTNKTGSLQVLSAVMPGQVQLNGYAVGNLPVTIAKVPIGEYQVLVNCGPHYRPYETTVIIEHQQESLVTAKLAPIWGTLVVESAPASMVLINGRHRGPTPLKLQLQAGSVGLSLEQFGYRRFDSSVSIFAYETTYVRQNLESVYGWVKIETNPPGASVTINGAHNYTSPVVLGDLSVGVHVAVLRMPGRAIKVRFFEVSDDELTLLYAELYLSEAALEQKRYLQIQSELMGELFDQRNRGFYRLRNGAYLLSALALGGAYYTDQLAGKYHGKYQSSMRDYQLAESSAAAEVSFADARSSYERYSDYRVLKENLNGAAILALGAGLWAHYSIEQSKIHFVATNREVVAGYKIKF